MGYLKKSRKEQDVQLQPVDLFNPFSPTDTVVSYLFKCDSEFKSPIGANIFYGKKESEYGGLLIPNTNYYTNAAPSAYVLFTCYF